MVLNRPLETWYLKLQDHLLNLKFKNSSVDSSLFYKISDQSKLLILVYVDDIVVIRSDPHEITGFIATTCKSFHCRELGYLNFFLGIQCVYQGDGLILSQENYCEEILQRFGYHQSNSTKTSMALSPKLQHDMGANIQDVTNYRSIVGSLQYLTLTRPNLSFFTINQVCWYLQSPKEVHLNAVRCIFRYLHGIENLGLRIIKVSDDLSQLIAYIDSY